jgi:hypothetical protein
MKPQKCRVRRVLLARRQRPEALIFGKKLVLVDDWIDGVNALEVLLNQNVGLVFAR